MSVQPPLRFISGKAQPCISGVHLWDPFCSQHSAQVGSAGRLGTWSFKLPLKGETSREGLRRIDDQAYVAAPFPSSTHRDKSSQCIGFV